MVYHNDWFAYIEDYLHPEDKSHLIIKQDVLMCCWILFAEILFALMLISDIGL